jgi:hypothetical protein
MFLSVWVDTSQLCVQGVVGCPILVFRKNDLYIVSLSINQMIQDEQNHGVIQSQLVLYGERESSLVRLHRFLELYFSGLPRGWVLCRFVGALA